MIHVNQRKFLRKSANVLVFKKFGVQEPAPPVPAGDAQLREPAPRPVCRLPARPGGHQLRNTPLDGVAFSS